MSETRSFLTSDGTRLSVDVSGTGTTVVFQHGLCGDAGQTREVFPPQPGLRRITVEARGHGGSEPGALQDLSISTFSADLAGFFEQELDPPVVVGGISMGAAIALRLAVKRPDLVRGLILARPAWIIDSAPDNMSPNGEVGRLLDTMEPEAAKAAFMAGRTGQMLLREAPDNLASLAGFFSRQPTDVTAALLTAIAGDGPGVTKAEVARLSVPTLVIGHGHDMIHPLSHASEIASLIEGARLIEITPKALDRARYVLEFRIAMQNFLKEL